MTNIDLKKIRKEYTKHTLSKKDVNKNPFFQFKKWFEEAIINEDAEVNAMVLVTVGNNLKPSARVVLLKAFDEKGFVFFTNYQSKKGSQILENPYAAIVFYWHNLERQVRIEGEIEKTSNEESDNYFLERPIGSNIGAIISPQSQIIPDRSYLENLKSEIKNNLNNNHLKRPSNWGGFRLKPTLFEFWQGRTNRLHDRIQYTFKNKAWIIDRLAP